MSIRAPHRLSAVPNEEREGRQELLDALAELAAEASLPNLRRLKEALEQLPRSQGDAPLSGEALLAARARNALRALEDRARIARESITASAVAEGLGVSRQRLHQLRTQGRLVAVIPQRRRGALYPAWQFASNDGLVPGLEKVIRASQEAGMGAETLHFFMTEPNGQLGGRTPADLVARGAVDDVAAVLRSAGLGPFQPPSEQPTLDSEA